MKETIEEADKIVQELLEEDKKAKLPLLIRTGINLINIGIQKYYDSMPKENSNMFSQSLSMKQSLVIVILIHVGVIAGIMWTSSKKSVYANEDKQYVGEPIAQSQPEPLPLPSPTPEPTPPNPRDAWQNKDLKPIKTFPKPTYTKEYIVKKGDTIYGICKKFKLNESRLRILNKIKGDKIYVGQTLKLL